MLERLQTDLELRKKIKRVDSSMSNVKVCPLCPSALAYIVVQAHLGADSIVPAALKLRT